MTLLYAQESGFIQILLEFCISKELLQEDKGVIEEIRKHTCCYIHNRFIEKPLLIKIIHFQSYPPELIQMMVEGVPSMHVCLEFLPEMLNAPARIWSDFGIMLSGYLIKKYPIHSSMVVAQEVLKQCKGQPSLKHEPWVLNALSQICSVFPTLLPEVVLFLGSAYTGGNIGYLSQNMTEGPPDQILASLSEMIAQHNGQIGI